MQRMAAALLLGATLAGCEQAVRDMYVQPRYQTLQASARQADGRAARPLEPGTIPHSSGVAAEVSSGRNGQSMPAGPVPYTAELLQRGRVQFDIYCAPCHGPDGDGDGYITQRGFPHPPSYHIDRLRHASDDWLVEVITNGYGAMYSFADRVAPADRRAIAAYIRALQRSQHASIDDVPEAQRAPLLGRAP
ncbi:MAG TPA: cytochrome c [Steroidobacteraceae bacterium]|nr:cytochrome c [Steroidobacteraceae bacterium]